MQKQRVSSLDSGEIHAYPSLTILCGERFCCVGPISRLKSSIVRLGWGSRDCEYADLSAVKHTYVWLHVCTTRKIPKSNEIDTA